MTKGNVGSLLVFDPEKITIDQPIKEASGDAVVGIVTERGGFYTHFCTFRKRGSLTW